MTEFETIGREEFRQLATGRDLIADLSWDEREWYANVGRTVLGVVVRDRIDNDWGFVVMTPDPQGLMRAVDLETSLPDIDSARSKLMDAMNGVGS